MVVGPTAPPSLTRGDLRWRIANRLGGSEEWAWRTVAGAGGAASYAPVHDLVIGGLNEQRGMWAWFADGGNAGLERWVTAFRPWRPADPYADPPVLEEPAMIEWAPALPEAVAPGHRIDLCVLRPSRINDAIDDAIRLLQEYIAVPAEVTVVTDGTSDRLALPADAVAVADVAWLEPNAVDGEGQAPPLPRSAWVMEPGRTVRVGSVALWGPFGYTLGAPPAGLQALIDYRRAIPLPTADDDLVDCLPAAIVDTAVSELALGMTELRPLLPLYLDQATRSRARAMRHDYGSLRPVMP